MFSLHRLIKTAAEDIKASHDVLFSSAWAQASTFMHLILRLRRGLFGVVLLQ